MREAVVVSYARTGMAKSVRGGFNVTPAMTLGAHAVRHAVEKAGVEKEAVEDCFLGNVRQPAGNLGRASALLADLPVTVGGVTINRFCSSGLQAIVMASHYVKNDGANVVVAGGTESLSLPAGGDGPGSSDPRLTELYPAFYMPMIETADIVTRSAANIRTSIRWNRSGAWPPPSRPASSRTRSCRWPPR
jgi:acetyl-CoA C-acetyltransferase